MKQSNFYQSLLTGAYPARAELCYCDNPDCSHEHERPKPQRDEPLEEAAWDDVVKNLSDWGVEIKDVSE